MSSSERRETIKFSQVQQSNSCYHCGEPLVPGSIHELEYSVTSPDGEEKQQTLGFCCNGCKQVFQIIQDSGNSSYYQFRTEFAPRPENDNLEKWPYEIWDLEIQPDEKGYKTADFLIQGIHCASCVWLNEKILSQTPGIIEAEVQLATNRAHVVWDPSQMNMRRIADIVAGIGYLAIPVKKSGEKEARKLSNTMLRRMAVAGFFMGNIMLVSVALYAGYFSAMDKITKNSFHYVSWLMATPVLFYSAWPFFLNAFHSLKQRVLSMDLLTSLGLSLAYFYSVFVTLRGEGEVYFDSVTFVTFAILIGRFIETKYKERTMTYLENLGSGLPQVVHRKKGGEEEDIPLEKAIVGDAIRVHPGELVPLDGVLINQIAEVDESMITGEFRALEKKKGEVLLAGSRCLGETIELEVQSTHEESTLAHITKLAEKSLRDLPRTQQIAEKASEIFILFVLISGIATFLFWQFIQKAGVETALINTVALLIVACPCALNLSIPTAFIVALQKAFSRGILLKGGQVLDELSSITHVVFDKTGTLTQGKMSIVRKSYTGKENPKLFQLACHIEQFSRIHHPITRAFASQSDGSIASDKISEIEHVPGRGLSAVYRGEKYLIGSARFMQELGAEKLEEPTGRETAVYFAREVKNKTEVLAVFFLSDTLRAEAASLIKDLKKNYKVVMLTGDHQDSAHQTAAELGIEDIAAELKPEQKKEYIEDLQKNGNKVLMVGDGINDAIALAQANVGVSFAQAAQISAYSSDMLFLQENLGLIDNAFRIARRTRRKIVENLTMSFFYNILLLPLAFLGKIIPLIGAIFMSLSSIAVVTNSLRLYSIKLPDGKEDQDK